MGGEFVGGICYGGRGKNIFDFQLEFLQLFSGRIFQGEGGVGGDAGVGPPRPIAATKSLLE